MAGELRSLNDLPDEILLKILSHFGPEDLCLIIAEVCERWNALSKNLVIWKTLSYSCDNSDISCVAKVLTQAPALHSLIIRGREDAVRILEILFDSHVDLRKLKLKNCNLGKDGTGLLTNIVALYPDLEVLSLEGCCPVTSAAYCLIPRLKKLSELNLSHCEGLCGKTVRLIADSCQNLKKFSLDEFGLFFCDDDIIHVIKKLGKQLTTLVVFGGALTDVAYSCLNKCARLQELEVSYCREMTDRGLLEGIGSLRKLTSLRLTMNRKLTAQALSTFLHQPSMTSVVLLNLSGCENLDDEGLKGIAKRCIHLKELAVCGHCNVTDTGIRMVISNCSQLHILNLTGLLYITGNGYLALVLSHLPHLRRLCFKECGGVSYECMEELVAASPELVVINFWGHVVKAGKNVSKTSSKSTQTEW